MPYKRLPHLRAAETLPDAHGTEEVFAETSVLRGTARVRGHVREATARAERFLDEWA